MADTATADAPAPAATDDASAADAGNPADLGDAGEKALKAERQARRAAERALKDAEAQLAELAKASMSEQEQAVLKARDEGKAEGLSVSHDRILKAEIKVAAGGKLADPADAVAYLRDAGELTRFVTADGDIDNPAIASAIDALVQAKPYLAPSAKGSGEGGPRGTTPLPLNGDPLVRALETKLGVR